jgi:murein L,D-transpeptidase YcbB/YkuD
MPRRRRLPTIAAAAALDAALPMRNPFKRLSNLLTGATPAAAVPSPPPLQQALALPELQSDLHHAPVAPVAPARSPSRALQQAGTRAVSRVAVQPTLPEPEPAAASAAFTHGVVLTQTERVRLRIMQAQLRLSGLMLYEGPIDGMLNLETVAALRHFQTLKGLRESGQVTAATLRALGVPTGP